MYATSTQPFDMLRLLFCQLADRKSTGPSRKRTGKTAGPALDRIGREAVSGHGPTSAQQGQQADQDGSAHGPRGSGPPEDSASSSSALARREFSSADRDLPASPPVEESTVRTAVPLDTGRCQACGGRSRQGRFGMSAPDTTSNATGRRIPLHRTTSPRPPEVWGAPRPLLLLPVQLVGPIDEPLDRIVGLQCRGAKMLE
jgi:hypothetical protein